MVIAVMSKLDPPLEVVDPKNKEWKRERQEREGGEIGRRVRRGRESERGHSSNTETIVCVCVCVCVCGVTWE